MITSAVRFLCRSTRHWDSNATVRFIVRRDYRLTISTHSHGHTHTLTDTHTLSQTHTHSHRHTHTLSQTHTHCRGRFWSRPRCWTNNTMKYKVTLYHKTMTSNWDFSWFTVIKLTYWLIIFFSILNNNTAIKLFQIGWFSYSWLNSYFLLYFWPSWNIIFPSNHLFLEERNQEISTFKKQFILWERKKSFSLMYQIRCRLIRCLTNGWSVGALVTTGSTRNRFFFLQIPENFSGKSELISSFCMMFWVRTGGLAEGRTSRLSCLQLCWFSMRPGPERVQIGVTEELL